MTCPLHICIHIAAARLESDYIIRTQDTDNTYKPQGDDIVARIAIPKGVAIIYLLAVLTPVTSLLCVLCTRICTVCAQNIVVVNVDFCTAIANLWLVQELRETLNADTRIYLRALLTFLRAVDAWLFVLVFV